MLHVGVVGAQNGEVIALSNWNPQFFEINRDSSRDPRDSEFEYVAPAVIADDLERRRRVSEFGVPSDNRESSIHAAIAQHHAVEKRSRLLGTAVFAHMGSHRSYITRRTTGAHLDR
jgi:hypothetical protein